MTPQPLRTVIIGFGKIADTLADDPLMKAGFAYCTHSQVLSAHPALRWEAVVDPSDEALARARQRWSIPIAVHRLEDLPAEFEAEVAVVTAPPERRAGILERLPRLKAVLLEKPLGVDRTGAADFIGDCQRLGVPIQVNLWRRADRCFRELAGGRLEELIGRPQSAFGLYGNGLFNNGSHLVDLVRMLLGEVDRAQATGQPSAQGAGPLSGDTTVPFALTLKSGAIVSIVPLDFRNYREVGLDIWGTDGRLSILQEGFTITHYPKGAHTTLTGEREIRSDRPARLDSTVGDALFRMYDNLVGSLQSGAPLWSPAASAASTEAVLSAVLESGRAGGKPVALS